MGKKKDRTDYLAWREAEKLPAVQFWVTDERGFNKVGGAPWMPVSFQWPTWKNDSLSFLAQVDLGSIPKLEGLECPAQGHLYFFFHRSQPWGIGKEDAGAAVVLFSSGAEACIPQPSPIDLPPEELFRECFLESRLVEIRPSFEEILDDEDYDVDAFEEAEEVEEVDPDAQMFGWPAIIQNGGMALSAEQVWEGTDGSTRMLNRDKEGAKDWILLFQLNSVQSADMMWGDMGMLYFWIRKEDLAKKRFDRVWLILQCY